MKLQDSYAVEANKLGSWKEIGYTAPGASQTGSSGSTANFSYSLLSTHDWQARSLTALNDCTLGSLWQVAATRNSETGIVSYLASLTGGPNGNCATLTPNFGKLSSDGNAGTINAN